MLVPTFEFNLENRRHERNTNTKRVLNFILFRDIAMLRALQNKEKIKTDSCKTMQLELSYSE